MKRILKIEKTLAKKILENRLKWMNRKRA